MQTKQALYQAAMRVVNARRQDARARAAQQRTLLYATVPGLESAQAAFRGCGIRATLAAAAGKSSAEALADLQAAQRKCDTLLQESGRPADCLEPKYTCPICQDTGTADGRTCDCVRKIMRRLRREEIEKASSLSVSSFETMEMRYYPEQHDAAHGWNIRHHMETVLESLRAYADAFDRDSANLLLTGNAGLGKTHAALAIAGVALDKGYDVIYMSSPEFFSQLETAHFDSSRSGDEAALMEAAREADLLILDDLGTEMLSTFVLSSFYTLLNDRLSARRPTIFTSNITDGTLFEKRYTEKIASRLAGSCECCTFVGEDIRLQKAQEE